jgi:lysophospholipid acyltransferase (LPLAT)-like uncharacterized protein
VPRRSKRLFYRLLEWIGPCIIRLLGLSLRIKKINAEPVSKLMQEKKPILWCLWHGRMFLPLFVHSYQGVVVMISQHSDGEMIARVVEKLGLRTVRGSSTRGGKEAFYEMLTHLKDGGTAAMLPDGPTGPRHHFKPGTLFLAQQSGSFLVPITFAARPCWRFNNSWDRFVLPKPFARCALYYGDPLQIPEKIPPDEVETWRQKLETIMVNLVKSAEAHFGWTEADV